MKQLIKKYVPLVMTVCLALCCLASIGCSDKKAEESDDAQADAAENIFTLGEESETTLNIVFTNELGAEITNIAVVPAGSMDDPAFLMVDEELVGNGEQVSVYIEPVDDQNLYDVIILVGENRYTLHDVDFGNWTEATIRIDGDVAYLEIILNDEPVSTLREEYDIAHPVVEETQVAGTGYYSGYDAGATVTVNQGEDSCVSDVVLR